jgi:hypothetical protein
MGCCTSAPKDSRWRSATGWKEDPEEVENPVSEDLASKAADEKAIKEAAEEAAERSAKEAEEQSAKEAEKAMKMGEVQQMLKRDAEEQAAKLAEEQAKREAEEQVTLQAQRDLATTLAVATAAITATTAAAVAKCVVEQAECAVQAVETAKKVADEDAIKEAELQIFTLPAQADRLSTPKITVGHQTHFVNWLNMLQIWDEELTKDNCNQQMQSGLLLCALMQHLVPDTTYISLNKKPRSRKPMILNIDMALAVVRQSGSGINSSRIADADAIYMGKAKQIATTIAEIFECFVMRGVRARVSRVLLWIGSSMTECDPSLPLPASTMATVLSMEKERALKTQLRGMKAGLAEAKAKLAQKRGQSGVDAGLQARVDALEGERQAITQAIQALHRDPETGKGLTQEALGAMYIYLRGGTALVLLVRRLASKATSGASMEVEVDTRRVYLHPFRPEEVQSNQCYALSLMTPLGIPRVWTPDTIGSADFMLLQLDYLYRRFFDGDPPALGIKRNSSRASFFGKMMRRSSKSAGGEQGMVANEETQAPVWREELGDSEIGDQMDSLNDALVRRLRLPREGGSVAMRRAVSDQSQRSASGADRGLHQGDWNNNTSSSVAGTGSSKNRTMGSITANMLSSQSGLGVGMTVKGPMAIPEAARSRKGRRSEEGTQGEGEREREREGEEEGDKEEGGEGAEEGEGEEGAEEGEEEGAEKGPASQLLSDTLAVHLGAVSAHAAALGLVQSSDGSWS